MPYTERHKMEFASIEVRACCQSFPNLPQSFDENDVDDIAKFCRDLREWLKGKGHKDTRILIQRDEYDAAPDIEAELSGAFERVAWKVQWDGEEGQAHAWTAQAYHAGMDRDLLAALVGAESGDALANLHGHQGRPRPGQQSVATVDTARAEAMLRSITVMKGQTPGKTCVDWKTLKAMDDAVEPLRASKGNK